MASDIQIAGLAELERALQDLPLKIQRNAMRGALRAGQKLILQAARANVPVRSGALRGSLRISTSLKGGTASATLRAGNKAAFYAHMVEFGTAAHLIEAAPGHVLAFGGGVVREVHHPGSQKHPFMRPAFDGRAEEAVQAVATYLGERIERAQLNAADPNS